MNNHTVKQMTMSSERCFQQNILNIVFIDSNCYRDSYRLEVKSKAYGVLLQKYSFS